MKKRNTTIFAFLLLAAVGIGVGYAALSQQFNVGGTVTLDKGQAQKEFTEEVIFADIADADLKYFKADNTSKAKVEGDSAVLDAAKHKVTWTVKTLAAKGEKATLSLTVLNQSDVEATIQNITEWTNSSNGLFSVTDDLKTKDLTLSAKNGETVDSVTFTITIEMLKDVTADEATDYTFGFSFVAKTA